MSTSALAWSKAKTREKREVVCKASTYEILRKACSMKKIEQFI